MRDKILDVVTDTVADLIYYNRKEDEELPLNSIEDAIINGDIQLEDILCRIRQGLINSVINRKNKIGSDL